MQDVTLKNEAPIWLDPVTEEKRNRSPFDDIKISRYPLVNLINRDSANFSHESVEVWRTIETM